MKADQDATFKAVSLGTEKKKIKKQATEKRPWTVPGPRRMVQIRTDQLPVYFRSSRLYYFHIIFVCLDWGILEAFIESIFTEVK